MSYVQRASRLGLASAVALSVLGAFAPNVSAAGGGTTRWVDNDGKAGPASCDGGNRAYTKIQPAVTASGKNDTVLVCPGTYRGTVHIRGNRDGLTLRGTDTWKATLVPPKAPATAGPSPQLNMINIDQVDDVTVRGLRISAADEPNCQTVDIGILILGSRRASIRGNQVFASPNALETSCGYQNGILISSKSTGTAATVPASALIAHNLIANFRFWGIAAGDDANVDATITDNSLHYYLTSPSTAAAPVRRASESTPKWSARRPQRGAPAQPAGSFDQAGIFVLAGANVVVNLNVIQSSKAADPTVTGGFGGPNLLQFGVILVDSTGSVVVRDNLIRRVFTGILADSELAKIDKNIVRKVVDGLAIGFGGGGNVVKDNVFSAVSDGIYVDSNTGGNTFRGNVANGGTHGCEDTTTGTGTAGTNNLWSNNDGNSSSPVGICGSVQN